MIKILVTTDFSKQSVSAIRYAIGLSAVNNAKLTFFYSLHLFNPVSLSEKESHFFETEEVAKIRRRLRQFILQRYGEMRIQCGELDCVVSVSDIPQSDIREYAQKFRYDYICIGTRGAGRFARFLGTNAANTIIFSTVPVIAVPAGYNGGVPVSIMYASDLRNIGREIKKVVALASSLNASIQLLHFIPTSGTVTGSREPKIDTKTLTRYPVRLTVRHLDYLQNLVTQIKKAVKKDKPSMLIMFTNQHRTLFQRLFHPSKSAQFSFDSKIPILVFNK